MACGVVVMIDHVWTSLAMKDLYHTNDIDGYFLTFLSKICFPHLSGHIRRSYPFSFENVGAFGSESCRKRLQVIFEWHGADPSNCNSVLDLVLTNSKKTVTCILPDERMDLDEQFIIQERKDVECLIFTSTEQPPCYDLAKNANWELRFVGGESGGKQHIYVRHGRELSGWWNITSHSNFVTKSILPGLDIFEKNLVLVFVRSDIKERYDDMRDNFLQSIGGQSHVYCHVHEKPLVVHAKIETQHMTESSENDPSSSDTNHNMAIDPPLQCCYVHDGKCTKTISHCCPIGNCKVCVCTKHIKNATNDAKQKQEKKIHLQIHEFQGLDTVQEDTLSEVDDEENEFETRFGSHEVSTNNVEFTENIENTNDESLPMEQDASDEFEMMDLDAISYVGNFDKERAYEECQEERFVTTGFFDYEDLEDGDDLEKMGDPDIISETNDRGTYMGASTTASLWNPVSCQFKKAVTSVSGSVILNNCGTLLARGFQKLRPSTWQGNFLQRLIATRPGRSIPLLYAEGTLFPSIFWKDDSNTSLLGAIPTALLASDQTLSAYGIGSVSDHMRNRIRMGGDSLCCQSQDYLCYAYDSVANLSCRGEDTRLVLRRGGLMEKVSRKQEDKNLLFDSESIESRPHVNQLCAKMRDSGATYFGSHSANHRNHFGLKSIKNWIDSQELHDLTIQELLAQGCIITESLHEDVKRAIIESSSVTMLRHWQETTELYMNYICHSPEKPLGKVINAWYRHEYQESAGNLSHLHFLLWIDRTNEDLSTTLERIRGSYLDFVSPEEIDDFVKDGMTYKDKNNPTELQDLAAQFLTHICSSRCMKRRDKNGDLQCRVTNNGLESPTPYKHTLALVNVEHTQASSDLLSNLGLLDRTEFGYVPLDDSLQGYKHYPPSRGADGKFSQCNNRLFAGTKSNQNLIFVTGYFASRYVAKYSAKIDESNRVYIGAGQQQANSMTLDVQFLHNTKITGSKINEQKLMSTRKDHNHPTGRAISIMEMMQATLGYDMVYTDIVFEYLPTTPLGERTGVKISPKQEMRFRNSLCPQDLSSAEYIATYVVRNKEQRHLMKEWQRLAPSETIILRDAALSDVSIDKITIFGVRPPELRFVRKPELYYKWFFRSADPLDGNLSRQLDVVRKEINSDVELSAWIDGLGYPVYARPKAVPDILKCLRAMNDDKDFYCLDHIKPTLFTCTARDSMICLFELLQTVTSLVGEITNEEEQYSLSERFFGPCIDCNSTRRQRELPIIWYDPIPPTQSHRFVIHLLLSMGCFDNEMNLLTHSTMKEAFEYAKLISSNITDSNVLEEECKTLLKNYVLQQLVFQPCGTKQFDRFLVAASQVIKECIKNNELPFREMPACLYTQLSRAIEESESKLLVSTKKKCVKLLLTI
jgi:hypothetical protein